MSNAADQLILDEHYSTGNPGIVQYRLQRYSERIEDVQDTRHLAFDTPRTAKDNASRHSVWKYSMLCYSIDTFRVAFISTCTKRREDYVIIVHI